MLLVFNIVKNGKTLKTLKYKNMSTILKNYVKYCEGNGFDTCIYSPHSFGNSAWKNNSGEVLVLVPVA